MDGEITPAELDSTPDGEASRKAARLIAASEGSEGRVESLDGGLTACDGELTRGPDGSAERADGSPDAPFRRVGTEDRSLA